MGNDVIQWRIVKIGGLHQGIYSVHVVDANGVLMQLLRLVMMEVGKIQ